MLVAAAERAEARDRWPAVPMSAIVPVYLLTSSPSPQVGVTATVNVPQSSMTTLSLPASGLVASVLVTVPRASVKTPLSEPVFSMSTVPSWL